MREFRGSLKTSNFALRQFRHPLTVHGSRGWHHRLPSSVPYSDITGASRDESWFGNPRGWYRKRCHWMDLISAHCCSRQCIIRSYSFVGPAGQRWIHYLPFVPSAMGIPLACRAHRQLRTGNAKPVNDDHYFVHRSYFGLLHGYHWCSSYLRYIFSFLPIFITKLWNRWFLGWPSYPS